MRASDCDILIVPGLGDSGPDHWQSRWEKNLSTARRVAQGDFARADRLLWVDRILDETRRATRPVVYVAHSAGVLAVAHAATQMPDTKARGAFLVAPPGATAVLAMDELDNSFIPAPRGPLPFPSILIASANDPYCPLTEAEDLAYAWGSAFTPAGDAGHINAASGHGPWPEGSLRFAMFLKTLAA
ncbi:MAG: alpha/beta hydrolase [Rhizobiales bacterium 65-9]|nr:serine hydrolase family protein [Hyphomicrobiales bacterium]OJY34341.1 MAG: alpha/beta hydrolase [Rhizobiales bacterium 65-9]